MPRGVVRSYAFGAVSGLGMLILFCFCYTEDAMIASERYGYAYIGVNLIATGSVAGARGLTSVVIILTFLGTKNFMTASSRQLMAFARDGGVPFGRWIAHIPVDLDYPPKAVIVVALFALLLNLVPLGSAVAFQAIVSLTLMAFIGTYELSMCVLIWRRFAGNVGFYRRCQCPTVRSCDFQLGIGHLCGLMLMAIMFYAVGGRRFFGGSALKHVDVG